MSAALDSPRVGSRDYSGRLRAFRNLGSEAVTGSGESHPFMKSERPFSDEMQTMTDRKAAWRVWAGPGRVWAGPVDRGGAWGRALSETRPRSEWLHTRVFSLLCHGTRGFRRILSHRELRIGPAGTIEDGGPKHLPGARELLHAACLALHPTSVPCPRGGSRPNRTAWKTGAS